MNEASGVYRHVPPEDEFKEIERLRSLARHNEASALGHARRESEKAEREKRQRIIAEKDALIAEKDALIAELQARIKARFGEDQ
jgi:hypothetical protein